ncbi:TetR family transcriptional regulator [Prauserella marina]|uniref:DNA-binding transcriptional regulator, AcrR family n=1 Tax=Prauserella marina TaxID=530584 RepID=A0A222VY02_9PSEU|nr:TetR/AcrR family transcriptional regulator [Prauserella marina]ASR38692.1 TetR family transcriptional regulator [Prauserella marina]PWV82029.1 TetR family transcriptional regulator [Prauserella marina]SDD17822.1 DNA-binding transcriptional regulator, AcrR family [Prauserella marina]
MVYRRTPAIQARMDVQRTSILDAAVEQLAEHGYAGCSMAAVATRAGVATGSVYRHFPGKAELVAELFTLLVTREVDAVERAAQAHGTVADRVVEVTDTFANRALKAPRLAYALLAEPVDAPVEEQRLVFRKAFRDIVAAHVAEGVAEGTIPPQDPHITAAAIVGAVAEVMIGPLTSGDPAAVEELRTFTLRALGAAHANDS